MDWRFHWYVCRRLFLLTVDANIITVQWWGSGLCFQIALMAALGVMAKIRVPYAHTSLEITRMRYGWVGHVIYMILNLTNNVFGCASMILTGSQLINGVSGMNFVAATILIPLGGKIGP